MADSVQAKARIQIDTDLGRDVLLATGIIGQETISRPYVYNLTLISKKFDIHPEQMLATKVGIRVRKEKEGEYRGLNGFVLSFAGGELHAKRREYRTYTMRVAPWLTLLDHGAEFRIFQDKNVLQIIDTVLQDAISGLHQGDGTTFGASPSLYYSLRAHPGGRYPTLEYCVQYNETEFIAPDGEARDPLFLSADRHEPQDDHGRWASLRRGRGVTDQFPPLERKSRHGKAVDA
jgi:type VI secretion system secreted protein VgrG